MSMDIQPRGYEPPRITPGRGLFFAAVAVAFFAAASWVGQMLVTPLVDSFRLRNAVTVAAKILNIEEKIASSGDGTTVVYHVTYTYEYVGKTYRHQTQRLALFGNGDLLIPKLKKPMS